MELISKTKFLELSGIPRQTLERWLRQGKFIPADYDGKNPLFEESQVEQAKALRKPYHRKTPAEINTEETSNIRADVDSEKLLPSNDGNMEGTAAPMDDPLVEENITNAPPAVESEEPDTAEFVTVGHEPAVTELIPFSFELAPVEESLTLDEHAARIREINAARKDFNSAFDIAVGFELIAAKEKVGHGGWAEWLKSEFEWTQQTANNLMRIAQRFGKLKIDFQFKTTTMIKLLALPVGDELAFLNAQSAAGRPVQEQSTRELQRHVEEWKARNNQIADEELNATGAEKDEPPIVEEPNQHPSTQEPRQSELFNQMPKSHAGGWATKKNLEFPSARKSEIDKSEPETESDKNFSPSREESLNSTKKLPPIAFNRNSSDKWYTPEEIITAAREVLGTIDLDPASDVEANETVKASSIFTVEENGLIQTWTGRVWLNPPFKNGLIEQFANKFIAEYKSGNLIEGIFLCDNATETRWFRRLVDNTTGIVFTTGRINFLRAGTFEEGNPTRGQAFFYYGSNPDKFYRVFRKFGWCCNVIILETSLEEENNLFDNQKSQRPT